MGLSLDPYYVKTPLERLHDQSREFDYILQTFARVVDAAGQSLDQDVLDDDLKERLRQVHEYIRVGY